MKPNKGGRPPNDPPHDKVVNWRVSRDERDFLTLARAIFRNARDKTTLRAYLASFNEEKR